MPATLQAGDIPALFDRAGCALRVQGTTTVVTTEALPGGEVLEVPCDYFLFERAA